MTCEHPHFESWVTVNRIQEKDENNVEWYSADVEIRCSKCKRPFSFIGLPVGVGQTIPTCSLTGEEARLPIKPSPTRDEREEEYKESML